MDNIAFAVACRTLPVFPLGGIVLLPGAVMPLHVFEPRYRALVADVRAGNGLFGMPTPRDPVPGAEVPDLHPDMGVARIVAHEALPDGRSHLLVQHAGVARIVCELPGLHGYRRVEAVARPPVPAPGSVDGIRALLFQLALRAPRAAPAVRAMSELDDASLPDVVAQQVLGTADERLRYLGSGSFAERMALVEGALAGLVAAGGEAAEA